MADKNKNYKCKYCNKYFSSHQSKSNHVKIKHNNDL